MDERLKILHVDMDAFFASVEQRDFPELRGKPVVVGGSPNGRGVVAAASYEARGFGIRSAMPCREAHRRCPQAIFRRGRMDVYQAVSKEIRSIFYDVTPEVEPLSVDEAFLDVGGLLHFGTPATEIAESIRARIRSELNLTASVGVAPNKFLAKVASDLNKPDGMTVMPVEPENIRSFLAPYPVGVLWGCGKKTQQRLKLQGVYTVQQIQEMPLETLANILGANAADHLQKLSFGIDERRVQAKERDKSISSERTFDQDVSDAGVLRSLLIREVEDVGRRLRKSGLWANTVQIKIRYAPFETITRQHALAASTRSDQTIIDEAVALLDAQTDPRPVRLIGVGVSKLTELPRGGAGHQMDLFAEAEEERPTESALDTALDQIRDKLGRTAVQRGVGLGPSPQRHAPGKGF